MKNINITGEKKGKGLNLGTSLKKESQSLSFKGGAYSLAMTAVVLAILIVINVLASVLPATITKIDTSSSQLYSITSNTKVVVNALQKDVTIYWIVQSGQEDSVIENLLAKYDSLSEHIDVVKKNPDAYPTFAAQYTDETVNNNDVIVECGSKYRYISYNDIYLSDIDYSTYSYVYSFDGEGAITSAINYVVSDDLPVIYTLTGHGESELPADLSSQIAKANIELKTLSLLNIDAIPEDADCLLVYAPASDLSEEESTMLSNYVFDGGRLLVISGPVEDGTLSNLNTIIENYGVTIAEGIVVENNRSYYAFGYPYILLPDLESSEITDPLSAQGYFVIFPLGQGMTYVSGGLDSIEPLLTSSETSYSKAAGFGITTYEKEEGDTDGPFTLALKVNDYYGGKLIWIGSSDFVNDTFNSYSSGANMNFVMNSIGSLIGETGTISVRSKSLSYNYLSISESTATVLKAVMIGAVPLAFIIAGIIVIVERRQRKHEQA